ncbi:MAG: lactonase family protein [Bacillota bacterium]|nr:lactonase family protein [Bacillota bacterium]
MTKNENHLIGYIGTYTKNGSEGIYSFILDMENAKIIDVKAAAKLGNPTYVTVSENNRFLYSVMKDGDKGGVASYAINGNTHELQFLNSIVTDGASPCHVSVDRMNHNLFSANYHKGTVESYMINPEDGSLLYASSVIEHQGSGPDFRQEKAHTHYAEVTPDEKFVAVVELGSDQLITYAIGEDAVLTEVNRLAVRPGSGPRHLTFHPNGKYAYIMTEFSSEVIVANYHAKDGSFEEKQSISTLPETFKENNQGSAIHISSNGHFVYAGNRGHNSIAVFSVNPENGELSFVERVSTEGDWPRDFVLDPTEKFLIASNQNSGNIVLYSRDEQTGKLTLLQSDIMIPDPVCIKFLNL